MQTKSYFALFFVASLTFASSENAQAQERLRVPSPQKRLAHAVHLIDTDPKRGAIELRHLHDPSAQAYLAYLYLARKVIVPRALGQVDSLMHKSIEGWLKNGGSGDYEEIKHYQYKDLGKLLRNLRFIAIDVDVPISIAKEHPNELCDALKPWWGSSADAWPQIEGMDKAHDITGIPQVRSFLSDLGEMFGVFDGSMRVMFFRREQLAELKASVAPQVLDTKATAGEIDRNLNDFMYKWSNQELWNKVKYENWLADKKAATASLSNFYRRTYKMPSQKALRCATRAVDVISTAYLGNYSPEELKDLGPNSLYRLFAHKDLTVARLKEHFPSKLTEQELRDSLRMAILNGKSLEIIEWLIKDGAPLSGGNEPVLLTAVLRPDVLELLLKSGANPNEKNRIGKTALIQAAQYDSLQSTKFLLEARAEINHRMEPPISPLHTDQELTDYFAYEVGNRTALMYATQFAGYPLIKYLIDAGADAELADSAKKTAGDYIPTNQKLTQAEKVLLAKMLDKK